MTQAEVLMTPEEAPVLTIEDVSIQFGDFKAVKHVSTEVGKNEVRFFIGPNGAGRYIRFRRTQRCRKNDDS